MTDFESRIAMLPVIRRDDYLVRPGDFFVTRSSGLFNRAIEFVQGYRSMDGCGRFGHAGFFVDQAGKSFEALWAIGEKDFFEAHAGQLVIIGRHECMSERLFQRHYPAIKEQFGGRLYFAHRLLFHLSSATAKWHLTNGGVCSEVTAKLAYLCEFWSWWRGATPDNIKDWLCDPWQMLINLQFVGWVNHNPLKRLKEDLCSRQFLDFSQASAGFSSLL
jgi:hypothetical protein